MKRKKAAKKARPWAAALDSRAKAAKSPVPGLRLASIRRQLLAMREDLMKTVRKQDLSESRAPEAGDSVDQASQSIERELLFELSDNERMTLDQIEAALRKIEKGSYGLCESCRKPIARQRLKALPFARYCISCQSSAEAAPEMVEVPEFRGLGEEAGL